MGRFQNYSISSSGQFFFEYRVGFMSHLYEVTDELDRKILVEFELHFARMGTRRS